MTINREMTGCNGARNAHRAYVQWPRIDLFGKDYGE